jgi:hypothetical protein
MKFIMGGGAFQAAPRIPYVVVHGPPNMKAESITRARRPLAPRALLSKFEITLANFEMQITGAWWGSRLRFLRL